jgi:hypothetical protein
MFSLFRLNLQRFPTLRLYWMFSSVYTWSCFIQRFSLNRFPCNLDYRFHVFFNVMLLTLIMETTKMICTQFWYSIQCIFLGVNTGVWSTIEYYTFGRLL